MRSRSDLFLKVAVLGLFFLTAGCSDFLARRDTIAYSAGNSLAANAAIQTINPWPRGSYQRGQQRDGVKAQQAARRYLAPEGGALVAPAAGLGAAVAAPPAQ